MDFIVHDNVEQSGKEKLYLDSRYKYMAKLCIPLYLAYNDNMIILPFRCILDVYVFYLVVF